MIVFSLFYNFVEHIGLSQVLGAVHGRLRRSWLSPEPNNERWTSHCWVEAAPSPSPCVLSKEEWACLAANSGQPRVRGVPLAGQHGGLLLP